MRRDRRNNRGSHRRGREPKRSNRVGCLVVAQEKTRQVRLTAPCRLLRLLRLGKRIVVLLQSRNQRLQCGPVQRRNEIRQVIRGLKRCRGCARKEAGISLCLCHPSAQEHIRSNIERKLGIVLKCQKEQPTDSKNESLPVVRVSSGPLIRSNTSSGILPEYSQRRLIREIANTPSTTCLRMTSESWIRGLRKMTSVFRPRSRKACSISIIKFLVIRQHSSQSKVRFNATSSHHPKQ